MPLDFARMMLQPTQATPWNLSGGGGGSGLARQQLQLAREQFEEQKRKARLDEEYRKAELGAEASRAAALREKEERDRAATQQATLLAQQQAGVQKFGELAGSGKVEQAQAMVPYLDQLGYSVKDLGGIGGLPVFELENRAQQAAAENAAWEPSRNRPRALDTLDGGESAQGSLSRMAGMGLDTSGARGTLDEPAGIGSTEDAFARAQAASQYADLTGSPARGPDAEDFQGAVPRNVIDLPAQQAETLARLRPMLGAVQESYPELYRESAGKTADAVSKSGLGAIDALALFKDLRSSPDSLIKAEIDAGAEKEKFREQRDELTPVQQEQLKGEGFGRANTSFKTNGVGDAVETIKAADQVDDLLEAGPRNHGKVVNFLMKMTGNKGSQTEQDALRTIGGGQISSVEQLADWLHRQAGEGFSQELLDSIHAFTTLSRENATGSVYGWLDSMGTQMQNPKTHERVRAGYEEFRDTAIPPSYLRQYRQDREKRDKARGGRQYDAEPMGALSDDFDIELEGQALESDLDPDKVKALIGPESGGRADARNKDSGATGLIQFLPSVAKSLGRTTDELAKMSPTEQLPFVMQYLSRAGLTGDSPAEDYAMAVAAPGFIGKPPETVVYPKGSTAWKQNAPWRPADGGDITVGSIQAFYSGKGKSKAAAAPLPTLPEAATAAEKYLRELMERESR